MGERFWTPYVGEANPKNPFDLAYSIQNEISGLKDHNRQLAVAREAIMRLETVSKALDGMPMEIHTRSAILPLPGDEEQMFMPGVDVHVRGECEGFAYLDLDQWDKGIKLAITLGDTVVWPAGSAKCGEHTGRIAYPLIQGARVIWY